MLTKADRLEEYFRRLATAPPCRSHDEAFRLVCDTLDAVEDELSGTAARPKPPPRGSDGRMYPPREDNRHETTMAGVMRYRTTGHNVFVRDNGAIDIRVAPRGASVFEKPGHDGRKVGDP